MDEAAMDEVGDCVTTGDRRWEGAGGSSTQLRFRIALTAAVETFIDAMYCYDYE